MTRSPTSSRRSRSSWRRWNHPHQRSWQRRTTLMARAPWRRRTTLMARTPWRRRATWHCHSWIGEDRGHWTQSAPVKEKSVTFSPMPLHDCRFNHHQNRIDSCIKSSKWNQVDQMVVERESERSSNKIKLRLPGALCWRGGEEQRMAVYHTVCGQTSATQLKTRLTTQIPNFPVLFWDSTQLKTSLTTQIPNFPVLFWDSTHLKTSLTTQIPNFPVLFWDSTQPKTSLTTLIPIFPVLFWDSILPVLTANMDDEWMTI